MKSLKKLVVEKTLVNPKNSKLVGLEGLPIPLTPASTFSNAGIPHILKKTTPPEKSFQSKFIVAVQKTLCAS